MHGAPTTFWGKLRRREGGEVAEWHPLFDHCADVAAVAAALLDLPLWRRRVARFAGREDLDETTRDRLACLAALHDLGKLNLGFQAKGRPELGPTAGHVLEALGAIGDQRVFPCLAPLDDWGEATFALLVASVRHHGRPTPFDQASAAYQSSWWLPRGGLDPADGAATLVARCREWFPRAFTAGGALPDEPDFGHAFAGLVMLADWIGSNTEFFPFAQETDCPTRWTGGVTTRGDGPFILAFSQTIAGAPPHTRGWTPLARPDRFAETPGEAAAEPHRPHRAGACLAKEA